MKTSTIRAYGYYGTSMWSLRIKAFEDALADKLENDINGEKDGFVINPKYG